MGSLKANDADFKLVSNKVTSKLVGPVLAYKIVEESEYMQDPNNIRFEIISNWYLKSVDERS